MVCLSGRRVAAAVFVVFVVSGGAASAQVADVPALKIAGEEAVPAVTPPPFAPPVVAPAEQHRPGALVPLYASFGALQILDARSTLHALDRGAVEANPVMKGIASHPVALFAVKAAATTGVIVASEKMWKKNRTAAVIFMLAANTAMGWVVQHNYAVTR
jgi:uncharacterized protein DUF5658